MPRSPGLFRMVGVLAALLGTAFPVSQAATLPSTGLMGVVKSSEGKPLEGVAVSARAGSQTFTTSVYTDPAGQYYFPPLGDGSYRVWAQAVGFEAARGELAVTSGKKITQNFTLKPVTDFQKQLSGTEWANSMPAETPEDRRMKDILHYNCSSCHETGFVLAKRFDATGWNIVLNTMIETQTSPDTTARKLLQAYQEELVSYLTKVRGPEPYPWKWKALPRATGEAAEIVVTEYDIPRGDDPNTYAMGHDGSDWSEGIPGRFDGQKSVMHDAIVGKDGNVYFTDNTTPERTVGKLDPKTGRVTSYKLPNAKDGLAVATHGVVADSKGFIWLTNATEGTMLRFDPRTEQFRRFAKPESMGRGIGGMIVVDFKGNLWTSQALQGAESGAFRLNPETGQYTEFKALTPRGVSYGATVDAEGNAWVAQLGADRLVHVNGRTGEVSEVILPPLETSIGNLPISAKDLEIGQRNGSYTSTAPLYQRGPRRLNADPKGDVVWVAEYFSGQLTKIDIHTRKMTSYPFPQRYSHPYAVAVDKNHMVWVCLLNQNWIVKFNPFTERFTEYPLPTLGTNIRFIDVDNTSDPPAVWVPYTGSNKLARVVFRTSPAR